MKASKRRSRKDCPGIDAAASGRLRKSGSIRERAASAVPLWSPERYAARGRLVLFLEMFEPTNTGHAGKLRLVRVRPDCPKKCTQKDYNACGSSKEQGDSSKPEGE